MEKPGKRGCKGPQNKPTCQWEPLYTGTGALDAHKRLIATSKEEAGLRAFTAIKQGGMQMTTSCGTNREFGVR